MVECQYCGAEARLHLNAGARMFLWKCTRCDASWVTNGSRFIHYYEGIPKAAPITDIARRAGKTRASTFALLIGQGYELAHAAWKIEQIFEAPGRLRTWWMQWRMEGLFPWQ